MLVAGCADPARAPIRIGLLVWPPYEIANLAHQLGYFADAPIEIVDYESPAVVQRAYRDGVVDVIAVPLDYVLQLAQHEPDHRIFLVVDTSHGGDVLVARPEIGSLAALDVRVVAVEDSALGAYVLRRALDRAGLSIDDIEVVLADIPDQLRAYLDGRVDAVVTYEPVRTHLLDAGARELFSSRDMPGEIVDVFVARAELLDSREEDLRGFVDGWMRGLDYLRADPVDAAAGVAPREQLEPDAFLAALGTVRMPDRDENAALLGGDSPRPVPVLDRQVRTMLDYGTLSEPVEPAPLLDARFVTAR